MQLINATRMQAGYTLGLDANGRERIVVAVKGTFSIQQDRSDLVLEVDQAPLTLADEFYGEPGKSAVRYEADFPPLKPRCDVVLNGSAWAPGGKVATRVTVSIYIGPVKKSFDVVGRRSWDWVLGSTRISDAVPFAQMPLHYGNAYGGVDVAEGEPPTINTYSSNPIGVGYYPLSKGRTLEGKPLPATEELGRPVQTTSGKYRPMSFGVLGRNFQPRATLAGTFDQHWLQEVFPLLPDDFNAQYHQSSPVDQQMDYPKGGEDVLLLNLTPNGRTTFRLPPADMPVEFTNAHYERITLHAFIDTIVIEPDTATVMITWRASLPLKRSIFEMRQVVVGRMSAGWYRARDFGKTYYPTLRAMIDSKKATTE